MKLNAWLTYKDSMDGSYFVTIQNTKEEALKTLGSTEEELATGDTYSYGAMEEIEIEIENGKLVKPIYFSVE